MSASVHPSSILASIATALGQVLAADPQTVTAEICGCSQPAVSRRGDDLAQWPAADLLRLALNRPPLADAIVRALRGQRVHADPAMAIAAVVAEVRLDGVVDNIQVESLSDGRVDRSEAARIRIAIMERRRHEDEVLLPALRVIEGAQS